MARQGLDFRFYIDCFDHPKLVRIQRFYGVVGVHCLFRLWAYATRYHPDGILRGLDLHDIERVSHWLDLLDERPDGLDSIDWAKGLIEAGLLDPDHPDHPDHGPYKIHDWADWQAWVIGGPGRLEKAHKAADARWNAPSNARSNAQNGNEQCSTDAPSPQIPVPRSKSISLEPTAPKRKQAAPLSEQNGLIGTLAGIEKRLSGIHPTWSGEEIIAFRRKRQANAHLKDSVFAYVYEHVWRSDAHWKDKGYPFGMFVRHLDELLRKVELEPGDYADAKNA